VDAQGGAYATGVLVLMASAAIAVTIDRRRDRWRWAYALMTLVFLYTLVDNVHERPEGIRIASLFIASIVFVSLVSRALRSTELRIGKVILTRQAQGLVDAVAPHGVRLVANRPDQGTAEEYEAKERQARADHSLDRGEPILFMEVAQGDASAFTGDLQVRAARVGRHRVLRCTSPAVANAIAALLLHLRDLTGGVPDAYFQWGEGNPVAKVFEYLAFGEGDVAPLTREVLRRAVDDPEVRPRIHVG
jgi:hypothetical protein